MINHAKETRKKLRLAINFINRNKKKFLKCPDKDFTRQRKLTFKDLITFYLRMSGKDLGSELEEYFNNKSAITVSGFSQQRNKLLKGTFRALLHNFNNRSPRRKTYKGYRLLSVDGSNLNIAHNPEDETTYVKRKLDIKGSNRVHINALYDIMNKVYLDAIVQPGKLANEHKAFKDMVLQSPLTGEVIVLADRGYESFNAFANLIEKEWYFLIRVKDISGRSILSKLDLPTTGEFDKTITRIFTRRQTKEVLKQPEIYKVISRTSPFDFLSESQKYYKMTLRVVKVELHDGTFQCFITNLNDREFSLNDIRELYHMRWGIETSFRDLKYKLGVTYLHSKKVEYIIQEVHARMVMYNFSSIITSNVEIEQKARKYAYQINFSKAINICIGFFKSKNNAQPPDVEAQIQKYILPIRPGRSSPRKLCKKSFISFNYRLA